MTDDELRKAAIAMRKIAAPIGPMHAYWDVIFDIEAILKGEKSICSRADCEEIIQRDFRQ
jgi:hypothetical protein